MSIFDNDYWQECITCGKQFSARSPRYRPGAIECLTCQRFGPPPPDPDAKTPSQKIREQYRIKTEFGEEPPITEKKEVA